VQVSNCCCGQQLLDFVRTSSAYIRKSLARVGFELQLTRNEPADG
jgi:hypothetical protein